ncbi:MAG: septum formation protein Maf [Candidatus Cloacimonadota bacterium]|nr:MAG: septum formation protein Maf [Candidatus Cloacimonadota bacterium]
MIHEILRNKKVVLASGSPRRKQIFSMIGLNALQFTPNTDETINTRNPRKFVLEQSEIKCRAVASKMDLSCVTVAADTIVFLNGRIVGKPENIFQATNCLSELSGNSHYVYTGVTVCYRNRYISEYAKSKVKFKTLDMYEIESYINTKEPMDKAGSYGIQGYGCQFVEKITGCYFNVMGFPVNLFYEMLKKLNIEN